MRASVQDGQSELITEFKNFAEHMVENNQKAIIEALEGVIRDFNNNLTEQFGENFKELNVAVKALVDWQENYRHHVEQLEARIELAVASTEASGKALSDIREHTEEIPKALAPLEPVLIGLNAQVKVLDKQLEAISQLRDKAIEAFPIVEENLQTITTQFAASAKENVEAMREGVEGTKTAHETLRKSHAEFLDQTSDAQVTFSTELEKTM